LALIRAVAFSRADSSRSDSVRAIAGVAIQVATVSDARVLVVAIPPADTNRSYVTSFAW